MKKLLLTLSFLPLLLIGQVQLQNAQLSSFKVEVTGGGSGWTPDSVFGMHWWDMKYYTTNAGTASVPDQVSSSPASLKMGNLVFAPFLTASNTVYFNGSKFLTNALLFSQPIEITIMAYWPIQDPGVVIYFDSIDGSVRCFVYSSSDTFALWSSSGVAFSPSVSSIDQTLTAYSFVFNGSASTCYSNTVSVTGGINPGNNNSAGIVFGGAQSMDGNNCVKLSARHLVVSPMLSTSDRASLYAFLLAQ